MQNSYLTGGFFRIGALFASFSLTRIILTPFIGARSDRMGRKRFICAGLLLYAGVSLLYIPALTIYLLIPVRMLHGFSAALIIPVLPSMTPLPDALIDGSNRSLSRQCFKS